MEDLLAMVGLGDSAGVGQDAEEVPRHPRASSSRDVHSIACTCTCTRAYAWAIGNEAIREQFMVWLKQGNRLTTVHHQRREGTRAYGE